MDDSRLTRAAYAASMPSVATRRLLGRLRAINAGHPLAVDGAVAATLTLTAGYDWWYSHDPAWRLPLQVLIALTVLARRRQPLVAFAVAVAAALALRVSPGVEGNAAIILDAYAIGRFTPSRWWALAVMAAVGVTLQGSRVADEPTYLLALVVAWLVGDSIRSHVHGRLAAERERTAAARATADERSRIARELHDVIAHSVSVMVVQAEGAKNVMEHAPALAAEAVANIADTGRETLAELRRLLEVLGSEGHSAALEPAPGTDSIAGLVERVRGSGQPVDLRFEGEPRTIPAGVGLTVFRVVQEGLTNAMRYATGAPTEVVVRYGARLHVEVVNGRPGAGVPNSPGSGRGLLGLHERVALHGGELTARPTKLGGFALVADIPSRVAET